MPGRADDELPHAFIVLSGALDDGAGRQIAPMASQPPTFLVRCLVGGADRHRCLSSGLQARDPGPENPRKSAVRKTPAKLRTSPTSDVKSWPAGCPHWAIEGSRCCSICVPFCSLPASWSRWALCMLCPPQRPGPCLPRPASAPNRSVSAPPRSAAWPAPPCGRSASAFSSR